MYYFVAEEDDLAQTITQFQISGFPLTINQVCQLAFQFAHVNGIPGFSETKSVAGRKWLKGFSEMPPQNNTQNSKKPLNRMFPLGANEMVISNWFNLLQDIKNKFGILSPC